METVRPREAKYFRETTKMRPKEVTDWEDGHWKLPEVKSRCRN